MSQKLLQVKEVELQGWVEEGGKSGEEMSLLTWEGNLQAAAALSGNEILPDNTHGFTNNAIDNT